MADLTLPSAVRSGASDHDLLLELYQQMSRIEGRLTAFRADELTMIQRVVWCILQMHRGNHIDIYAKATTLNDDLQSRLQELEQLAALKAESAHAMNIQAEADMRAALAPDPTEASDQALHHAQTREE